MPNDDVVVVSPVTGEPLTKRNDGFYEAPNDKQLYIYVDEKLTPLVSPKGNPMVPVNDGLFYCEQDGLYYKVAKDDLIELRSPIDGQPLVPLANGKFDSESDDLVYEIHNGVVIPLVSPDGYPIMSKGDGTYYCEADDSMYEITEKGRVNKVTEEELERRREREAEYYDSLENENVLDEDIPEEIEIEDEMEEEVADSENLYGYDVEAANIILNSYVLGEIGREAIEEAFDSLGLPYTEELFEKLEKAKLEFQEYAGRFEKPTNNKVEAPEHSRTQADEIDEEFSHYNTPSFMDPIKAYKLNREYRDLTGKDHPKFLDDTLEVIASLNRDKATLKSNGAYDPRYFDALNNISEYVRLKRTIHYEDRRHVDNANPNQLDNATEGRSIGKVA